MLPSSVTHGMSERRAFNPSAHSASVYVSTFLSLCSYQTKKIGFEIFLMNGKVCWWHICTYERACNLVRMCDGSLFMQFHQAIFTEAWGEPGCRERTGGGVPIHGVD